MTDKSVTNLETGITEIKPLNAREIDQKTTDRARNQIRIATKIANKVKKDFFDK